MEARRRALLVALAVLALAAAAEGYNITKILAAYPEYSQFNKLLTQTRLAQDINKRRTITVLVVANGDMGSLAGGGRTLQTIRHMLQIHVLVDYYGGKKLHQLAHGVTACSSMFQHRGGKVTFTAEDAEDSAPSSAFVKSVKEIPYDLAVLQISKVLASPEAEAPVAAPAPVNITELLSKKYCKSFAGLLAADADAYSTINATKDNGLTLFCPVDSAVASFMPKYKNLTAKGRTAILLYHAVPDYYSLQLLTSNSGKVSTLATSNVAKKDYSFDVEKDGETAELDTKVNSASVTYTIKDDDPLAVYAISKFLQPKELYKIAKDIAPAPAPEGPKKKKTTKKKPSAAASPSDDDDDDDSAADSPDDSSSDDATADKDGAAPSAVAGWVTAAVAVASALALAA
ncbi:hypothetical protein CFC21_011168 [Triticum aestivum]|uniref:FAS1 domain-containing protein n=2 Tax=Triticum aestivum TaxID=4565 RepID=A0A9R1IVT3_WHEAT|nr:hypothetical protein CFC21_011168 [Triticum aestivum]